MSEMVRMQPFTGQLGERARKSGEYLCRYGLRVLLGLCLSAPLPGGDIVIGVSSPFTGAVRANGIELYRGSMAYFEYVNQRGGVHGRKITVKALDDGYKPPAAIANTMRLIEQEQVFLLFDYMGTAVVTRILPVLKLFSERDVYLFFPYSGAEPQRLPPYDSYVFNLRASYRQETEGLVENLWRIGRKRIAVFYQADAFGRGGWEGVQGALAKHGLKIVAEATYRHGTPFSASFKPQVEILRQAKPDAVISIAFHAAGAGFIRDAREAGWDVPIANLSIGGSAILPLLSLESARTGSQDYTSNLINSEVVPSFEDVSLPAVRQYRELMDRFNPLPPKELSGEGYTPFRYSHIGLEGFLNAKVLVEVLARVGDPPAKGGIRRAVENMQKLDIGIDTPVSFGGGKHQGLDKVYYFTVAHGRYVPVRDWQRWRP